MRSVLPSSLLFAGDGALCLRRGSPAGRLTSAPFAVDEAEGMAGKGGRGCGEWITLETHAPWDHRAVYLDALICARARLATNTDLMETRRTRRREAKRTQNRIAGVVEWADTYFLTSCAS